MRGRRVNKIENLIAFFQRAAARCPRVTRHYYYYYNRRPKGINSVGGPLRRLKTGKSNASLGGVEVSPAAARQMTSAQ